MGLLLGLTLSLAVTLLGEGGGARVAPSTRFVLPLLLCTGSRCASGAPVPMASRELCFAQLCIPQATARR